MSYGMTNPCLHHVWYLKYLGLLSLFGLITCALILENSFHLCRLPSPLPLLDLLTIAKNFEVHKQRFAIYFYIYLYIEISINTETPFCVVL